jgi:hypothetical protein
MKMTIRSFSLLLVVTAGVSITACGTEDELDLDVFEAATVAVRSYLNPTSNVPRASAQGNLANGDFEQKAWSSQPVSSPAQAVKPPEWNHLWWGGGTALVEIAATAEAYSGDRACLIDVIQPPPSGYLEFGKVWKGGGIPGHELRGRLRIKLSRATLAGQLAAYEFNPGGIPSWVLGTKSLTAFAPTTEWQEIEVAKTVQNGTGHVRFTLEFSGLQAGDRVLVDYATFTGSNPSFHGTAVPDQEVLTDAFSLLLDGKTGQLRHLRELPPDSGGNLGPDLLSTEHLSELFTFQADGQAVVGSNQIPASVQAQTDAAGELVGVTYDYAGHPVGDFEVRVSKGPDDEEIRFQILFASVFDTVVLSELNCPFLRTPTQLGVDLQDDRYLQPKYSGELLIPALHKLASTEVRSPYPGVASVQLQAYFDDSNGFGMYAADGTVESKEFLIKSQVQPGQASTMTITHHPPRTAGAIPGSYPVVLFPCRGDWRVAAEKYRDWALQQFWSQGRVMPDPEWVTSRPPTLHADLRPKQIGATPFPLDPVDRLAEILDAWQLHFDGSPVQPLYRGFERLGTYANGPRPIPLRTHGVEFDPDTGLYNEVAGQDQIQAIWNAASDHGHINMAMVAGLNWAIERDQSVETVCDTPNDRGHWFAAIDRETSDYFTGGGPEVCLRKEDDPHPLATVFTPTSNWDTTRGIYCPGHPQTLDDHAFFAEFLAERGIDHYEFDQFNNANAVGCIHENHDHPKGRGRWWFEKVSDVLHGILTAGRSANPDFSISMEHPSESYIPWVHAFYARPHKIYPSTGKAEKGFRRVVPLFQYIYSSKVQTLIGEVISHSAGGTHRPYRDWTLVQQARSFAAGAVPYVWISDWQLIWDAAWTCVDAQETATIEPLPSRMDPVHLAILTNMVRLGQGPAKKAFESGLMVSSEGGVFPEFAFQWPKTYNDPHSARAPMVSHSAWRLDDGTYGIALAHASLADTTTCFLPPVVDGRPVPAGTDVTVYRNGETTLVVPYADLVAGMTLSQSEVAWIEFPAF